MVTKILILVVVLLALAVLGWMLLRFAIQLEKHGYIYYREKSKSGGMAGVLQELDQLVRPNSRHVVEAEHDLYSKESDEQGDGKDSSKRSDGSSDD